MSLLLPFALRLERFVYDTVCSLSMLAPPDGSDGGRADTLASPDPIGTPHSESKLAA